jgi:hypothetical protein
MKHVFIAAMAITLFLIVLASPPYTNSNAVGSSDLGSVHWANPDGSGVTVPMITLSRQVDGAYAWTNPDGTHGVAKTALGPSSATSYPWVNPDGTKNLINKPF